MKPLNLHETAQAVNGQLTGGVELTFARVTTDSRDIRAGDLFVAIKGERFDGHDYVAQALQQGAVAALVESGRDWPAGLSLIEVDDTVLALGRLAAHWRNRFSLPVIAVTGSNGKTSVKEMIAAILRHVFGADAVLATQGNLNNHLGVPQMLLRLSAAHRVAVLEMGMNHFGEIRYLTTMARPDVALVNNAGAAHLEYLGSVEGVARAKGEIYEGLTEQGIAVFNQDDAFADYWRSLNPQRRCMAFGLQQGDVSARALELDALSSRFVLCAQGQEAATTLAIAGEHMVRNALAAASACLAIGLTLEQVAAGLATFSGVKGRLQLKAAANGARVIDDTYNANPMSMRAAIDVLARLPAPRLLVLGDMGEVGENGPACHAEVCAYAAERGIEALLTTGAAMQAATAQFGANGRWFADQPALIEAAAKTLTPASTVLVKGSRFMAMERVVDALVRPLGAAGKEN